MLGQIISGEDGSGHNLKTLTLTEGSIKLVRTADDGANGVALGQGLAGRVRVFFPLLKY